MIERPIFDPRYRVVFVPGDGVHFVAEGMHALLPGQVFEFVAKLIDGHRTSREIGVALDDVIDRATTYYALLLLERDGYVREAPARTRREARPPIRELEAVAAHLGAGGDVASLMIVDDYLAPGLDEMNRGALRDGRRWIMARVVGDEIWIGPTFVPGRTACWSCLAHWLRTVRPVDAYLERRRTTAVVLAEPGPANRSEVARLARMIASDPDAREPGILFRFDRAGGRLHRSRVHRRPQCDACGDPGLYARRLERFELAAAPHGDSAAQLTGVTAAITKLAIAAERIHVYAAAPAAVYDARDAASLNDALRYRCVGSGPTPELAMAAVIGETIERYCGTVQGDEPRIAATLAELGDRAIHPNACMLFSDAQYAARDEWNARGEPTAMVAEPFDPDDVVDWTPAWSLTKGEARLLPTAFLYRGAGDARGAYMCVADSNGCAAGRSLADATVRGFLELAERDSIALWWYRRAPRPAVDVASLRDSYARDMARSYQALGRELWVLDITTDLGVPTYAAVTRRIGEGARREEILFGFGADFDAEAAITHAISEMNQLVASFAAGDQRGRLLSPAFAHWLEQATVDEHPYLLPSGTASPVRLDEVDARSQSARVACCRAIVESRGMELLVLDQTRADVALSAAKVIVPGLRPAAPRFSPGRLHDGGEGDLNSIPFFL